MAELRLEVSHVNSWKENISCRENYKFKSPEKNVGYPRNIKEINWVGVKRKGRFV